MFVECDKTFSKYTSVNFTFLISILKLGKRRGQTCDAHEGDKKGIKVLEKT